MAPSHKGPEGGKAAPALKVAGGLVLMILLAWGVKWLHYRLTHAVTDAAFVEADMVTVAPLVAGHILDVKVKEGEWVKRGTLLATIDQADYQAAVQVRRSGVKQAERKRQQAEAAVQEARAALSLARKEVNSAIAAAEAKLRAARSTLLLAEKEERRLRALLEEGAVSQQQYDEAATALAQAKEALNAAKAGLSRAKAQEERVNLALERLAGARKALLVAEAALEVNQRKLDQALLNLAHTRIEAPQDGVIAAKFVNPGDFVSPGRPLFSMYDPSTIHVVANLEETKLKGVKQGQEVDVWVDAWGGRKIKGKVALLTPAAAAKFALIPRDVSAGEFTKVVQRIPVKIEIDLPDGMVLAPGMSVEIGIARE